MEDNTFPLYSEEADRSFSVATDTDTITNIPFVARKARARSTAFSFDCNPLVTPLNPEEENLTKLIQTINQQNQFEKGIFVHDRNPTPRFRIDTRENLYPPNTMNYQSFETAGPSNPRQAPQTPTNGMNGGNIGIGAMVGFPTPAGHQSDLNYIYSMVEELSKQLQHNERLTSGVVDKVGKVREKAQNMDLSNDELIALVAAELNDDTQNLEKECSELRKQLEKAEYNKDENWKLAIHGCNILSDILEKMHKFKEQHEIDTLAWHKNYRKQLAEEREENLVLRNQINDMRAAACRANEWLRKLRCHMTDHDELNKLRIQNVALRQEKRFWKRMALPLLADDDSEFSDDDDMIDPEEKKRLAAEKAEKERKEKESDAEGGQGQIA